MSMTSEESLLRYPMTIIKQGKAHEELQCVILFREGCFSPVKVRKENTDGETL